MTSDYQAEVERKLKFITAELEKVYGLLERLAEPEALEIVQGHRKTFIVLMTAYERYIGELKRGYGSKLTELPRKREPSSKYGGNS